MMDRDTAAPVLERPANPESPASVPSQDGQAADQAATAESRGTPAPRVATLESPTIERLRPPWGDVKWFRVAPFFLLQLACVALFWVGVSPVAVGVCVALYVARMFAITGFYHRYFAHRTFRTSRPVQFVFALLGNASAQRGPLWWAAHHRVHHRASDTPGDVHSPLVWGFWWGHMFWFMTDKNYQSHHEGIPDFARYPELRFIDRHDWIAPVALGLGCFGLGELMAAFAPGLGTSGWQMLVWGFVVSTTLLYHGTFTINSLTHQWGRRRFATTDDSRNSLILALITLGEGWHNNHHRYPHAVAQGFYKHQIDISHMILWTMSKVGLVWDMKPVPAAIMEEGRRR